MSKRKRAAGGRKQPNLHKVRHEYNLETDPLQTGEQEPAFDLRAQGVQGRDLFQHRRRFGGWLVPLFIVIVVLFGVVALLSALNVFDAPTELPAG
jgi:hypothetical protein